MLSEGYLKLNKRQRILFLLETAQELLIRTVKIRITVTLVVHYTERSVCSYQSQAYKNMWSENPIS